MTSFHDADGRVFSIMRHVRSGVEKSMNSMSAITLHDRISELLNVLLDDVADFSIALAGLHNVDCLHESVVGHLNEFLVLFLDISDEKCLIEVSMKAAMKDGHVEIANVAIDELTSV